LPLADDIHIRRQGKAGRITLTRPEVLNAMTYEMAMAIEKALDGWRDDDAVSIVIIDAEGDRSFCSGGDIQQLYDTGRAGDFEYGRKFWKDEYRLNAKIVNYPKPYVAIMDGIVMGGGVGISAHGSLRIVTENTLFAMPECAIGLVPDVGGSYILANAPGHIGEYLGSTGARLKAGDTIYAGFADNFIPASKLDEMIGMLAESGEVEACTPYFEQPEAGYLRDHIAEINDCFEAGTAEEIVGKLDLTGSEWALAQAKLMRRNCPLSVACAIEMVRRLKAAKSVEEALALEYRFTFRSMSHGEFIEGIRAQIIDKDRNPKWNIASLEDVTVDHIATMLGSLGDRELKF